MLNHHESRHMRQALLRRMGAVAVALGLATIILPEEAQAVLLFSTSSPGWQVSTDPFDVNIGPDVAQLPQPSPGTQISVGRS